MVADGCAIFLVERDTNYNIIAVFSDIAGKLSKHGIKPNKWYTLRGGKPVLLSA